MSRPLILSLAILLLTAASTHAGNVTIKGKITHPLSGEITFSAYDGRLEYNQTERTVALDKSGNFSVSFPVTTNYMDITIQHGDQASEVMLRDGDAVTMSLDAADFDKSMRYTGKGAVVANFVARHVLDRGMTPNFSGDMQPLMAKEPQAFMSESKAKLQEEMDYLEQHQQGLPEDFIRSWKAKLTYSMYYNWLIYPVFHEMMKGGQAPSVKVPRESYIVPASIPMDFNDDLLSIPSYRNVVGSIFDNRSGGLDSAGSVLYKNADSAAILARQFLPEKSREFYFAYRLYSGMKYATVGKSDSGYKSFRKMYPSSSYLAVIEKAINLKRKLGAGQPAIDMAFTTLEGKKMKLSDLKGKVVYIDFWASWCGPCMAELPAAKKIKEHFKGRDVAFLYVSIDEDEASWKNAIDKKKIEGIHTFEPGGWKSRLAMEYGIKSVPSYFLVDKAGKFVTEVTPRPSDTEELIKLIEGALE